MRIALALAALMLALVGRRDLASTPAVAQCGVPPVFIDSVVRSA